MKAVLWDLDDTLLNTLPARMRSLKHAYETVVGGWTDPVALWTSHRGGTLEDLGRQLCGENYRRFAAVYRDHYFEQVRRAPAFEGVEEALTACIEHGLKLAVVTSKVSWGATEELEEAELLRFFAAVVGFDDTELHKPDPEPIFTAMQRLLIDDARDVVFVGDSPADMFAARNAGCVSVAAAWGSLDVEMLLDSAPVYIARSPRGVLDAIQSVQAGGGK